jgi:hypothetical protein
MTCETCGRPEKTGLFQFGQAIFAHIEPHLTNAQIGPVQDAIDGFMTGKPLPEEKACAHENLSTCWTGDGAEVATCLDCGKNEVVSPAPMKEFDL